MANIGLAEDSADHSFHSIPAGTMGTNIMSMGSTAASDSIPKHLLAQEVQKLRKEAAALKASQQTKKSHLSEEEELNMCRERILEIERQKAEFIEQFSVEKAEYYREIKELLTRRDEKATEVAEEKAEIAKKIEKDGPPKPLVTVSTDKSKDLAEALQRKKDFEENFTRTVRDLRKELEQSDLKQMVGKNQVPLGIKSTLQLSNERIEKVMEEISQVPVEERLHIETLRCMIENAKLRKLLNSYSEGLLANTLSRAHPTHAEAKPANKAFGLI